MKQMQPSGQLAVLPSQLQMEAGLPQRQDRQPVKVCKIYSAFTSMCSKQIIQFIFIANTRHWQTRMTSTPHSYTHIQSGRNTLTHARARTYTYTPTQLHNTYYIYTCIYVCIELCKHAKLYWLYIYIRKCNQYAPTCLYNSIHTYTHTSRLNGMETQLDEMATAFVLSESLQCVLTFLLPTEANDVKDVY